jgi:threonine aldolase
MNRKRERSNENFMKAPFEKKWLRHAHTPTHGAALEHGLRECRRRDRLSAPGQCGVHRTAAAMAAALHGAGWQFYSDVGPAAAARLMCAWDTTPEDVAAFLRDAAEKAAG